MKGNLIRFLLPEAQYASTDFRVKKQLPFLALTSVVLLSVFILLEPVALLSSRDKVNLFELLLLILIGLAACALVALRKGKYSEASWMMSATLLGSSLATLFTMPYSGSPFDPYRPFAFSAVMAACTMLVSLKRIQIRLYGIAWISGWVLSFATIFRDRFEADISLTAAILLAGVLGVTVEIIVLDQVRKLSDNLLETALDETRKATAALNQINALLAETAAGMEIGAQIQRAADSLVKSVESVTTIQNYLGTSSESLLKESGNFAQTSSAVTTSIETMKKNLEEQSSAITQTSAAITQISTNLQNISGIATKRRVSLADIAKSNTAQRDLVQNLLASVELVQKSSEGIALFVHTVEDIASRTGLLSMNASIEAARAGSAGKGFSIIAQEIRALSEETRKNAGTIKQLLDNNETTVASTVQMTQEFAGYIEKSSHEMKDLVDSIDEILRGVTEMDIGTREVMNAVQEIVESGSQSSELVNTVVKNVGFQRQGFEIIARFSRELHERIISLQQAVDNIRGVSAEIAQAGAHNTTQVQKIQKHLEG
jgi:methyl-accepting chemotaxis protein